MTETKETNRPGGAVNGRPLHFFWIVDCSGSMIDERIAAVNHAIQTVLPSMKEEADNNPNAQVLIHTLKFSNSASWVTPVPIPLEDFTWSNLDAERGALTAMGDAFARLAEKLTIPPMTERGLPPVLVLLSDGQPTDDYAKPLEKLLHMPWGTKAVRIAISIGKDADDDVLQKFTGNRELVLQANSPEALVSMIRWTSTIVRQVSQPGSQELNEASGKSNVVLDTESIPEQKDIAVSDVW